MPSRPPSLEPPGHRRLRHLLAAAPVIVGQQPHRIGLQPLTASHVDSAKEAFWEISAVSGLQKPSAQLRVRVGRGRRQRKSSGRFPDPLFPEQPDQRLAHSGVNLPFAERTVLFRHPLIGLCKDPVLGDDLSRLEDLHHQPLRLGLLQKSPRAVFCPQAAHFILFNVPVFDQSRQGGARRTFSRMTALLTR